MSIKRNNVYQLSEIMYIWCGGYGIVGSIVIIMTAVLKTSDVKFITY